MKQLTLKKQKKTGILLNLDAETIQRLDAIKDEHFCSRTQLINQIILKYLISYEKTKK